MNRSTFSKRILPTAIGAILTLPCVPAMAEIKDQLAAKIAEQYGESEQFSEDLNKIYEDAAIIYIYGSETRLKNEYGTQPFAEITKEDIAASGAANVFDVLSRLPQVGANFGPQNTNINTLNLGSDSGASKLNLRGLGEKRTLVLVNGKRYVGVPGSSAVDLNTIPLGMVEGISVVTGGTSAVHGADAVTGVVNVQLKSDFYGTEFAVRTGETSKGDGETQSFTFTHGNDIDDINYVFSLAHTNQGAIKGSDREFVSYDGSAKGTAIKENGSGVHPGGLLSVDLGSGKATGGFAPDGTFTQPYKEKFQRVPFRNLQNPYEHNVFYGRIAYENDNDVSFYAEATSVKNKSSVEFEPQLGVFSDKGFVNSGAAGFRFPTAPTVNIDVDGDGNPDEARLITRRFTEFGTRRSEIERDGIQIVFGAKGENFGVYAQHGNTGSKQIDFNTIDKFNVVRALDPVACGATPGCTFLDVYTGREKIDPAALNYVSNDLVSTTKATQTVLSGYINKDIGSSLKTVFGAEYRYEYAENFPSSKLLAQEIDTAYPRLANPATETFIGTQGTRTFRGPTVGDFDVVEVFGELQKTFAEKFDVRGAVRFSDYSTVGSEVTGGLSANVDITDKFRFRTTKALATRAPNVNELFAPSQNVTSSVLDPCDSANTEITAKTKVNCGVLLSGANNLEGGLVNVANFGFANNIRAIQSGGNASLDSEKANTTTVGFVFTPNKDTTVSVDYYKIAMSDVLSNAFNAQETANTCVRNLDEQFCNNVVRDSNGVITTVTTKQLNLAKEDVEGIDIIASHQFDLGPGSVHVRGNYAHLIEHARQVHDDAPTEQLAGRVDNLENKFTLTTSYRTDNASISLIGRFLSDSVMTTADENVSDDVNNSVPSIHYVDLYGEYNFNKNISVNFGIQNLTDEEPPIVTNRFEGNGSADSFSGGIHDLAGQTFQVGFTLNL